MASFCAKKQEMVFLKWFERPKDPSNDWIFTADAIEIIKKERGSISGFEINNFPNEFEELEQEFFTISSESSLLDSYLQSVSESEAKFPDTSESKLIFETFDDVAAKMVNLLAQKSDLFKDCTVVKVGSTSEGLKSGRPNEFDYNLILPTLSKYTNFFHSSQNNSLNDAINAQFFADIIDSVRTPEGIISFEIEDFDILKGIVCKSELVNKLKEDTGYIGDLIVAAEYLDDDASSDDDDASSDDDDASSDDDHDDQAWRKVLGPSLPIPQRCYFEIIFSALDEIIEASMKQSLPETLTILPKKSVRQFRSMNQVAITLNLLWKENFEISVDFAIVIPAKKKPLWYDFDVYLVESGKSMLPYPIQLQTTDETFNYVVRSYKTCRLSNGEIETKMFGKFPVDHVIKQSIRVCKKLRDIYMKHYFDIATESINPVMPSYWIKTVAMHLFKVSEPSKYADMNIACLSKCVMEILRILHKCLTGDQGVKRPFLASYTDPFKNLLQFAPGIDDEDVDVPYLDDELKAVLCHPNINAANDIQCLLTLLNRLEQNDEFAKKDLEAMRKENDLDKIALHDKGMREKLGILMYQQHAELGKVDAAEEKSPSYIEFINHNFPSIKVIHLGKEKGVEHNGVTTMVDVKLIENDTEIALDELFEAAYRRINYYGCQSAESMMEDYYKNSYD